MALKHLQESDDWYRICGIHGNTFKPNDSGVLCPTDPNIVTKIGETGEPFYCKHSVYSFIGWHTPYIYQFELLLNKYNKSQNTDYITLPYLDLTNTSDDFNFINDTEICIMYDKRKIYINNPLASAYYYKDGEKIKITREGFLTPTTKKQKMQINTVRKQLNNSLYAISYERFSSVPVTHKPSNIVVDYVPLETPHNQLHDIIGGNSGNMSDISISAFDPIFWLHHCNMDRHFYSWMYYNTNKFSKSIYPDKMLQVTHEKTQAPFFNKYVYSSDYNLYNYGWMNNKYIYLKLKDLLKLEKYPYKYDIIVPTPKTELNAFVELIDIPIPRESLTINMYIYHKDEILNKESHFAGSASWLGINRNEKKCERCEVTRTNIKIDIEEYINTNNITTHNIDDYNAIIEGEGRLIKDLGNYKIYNIDELVKDGSVKVIIK
jgi:hypothetical protein